MTVTGGADDTEYLLEKSGFEQSCPTVIASIMYDNIETFPPPTPVLLLLLVKP